LRPAHIVLTAALLAGCSSNGTSPVLGAMREAVFGGGREAPPAPPSAEAAAQALPDEVAAIRIEVPAVGLTEVAIGISKTEDRVTYLGTNNRTLVLRGGLVSSTHGFGYDMAPVAVVAEDPIVRPRPVADWPAQITRQYQTVGTGPVGEVTTVTCSYSSLGAQDVDLPAAPGGLVRMQESCEGDGTRFRNLYDVEPGTGRVWQSGQWTGPRQGAMEIQVLEPLEE